MDEWLKLKDLHLFQCYKSKLFGINFIKYAKVKDARTLATIKAKSTEDDGSDLQNKETVKFLLSRIERTEEMLTEILTLMKGGALPPTKICSDQSTSVDSSGSPTVSQKRKFTNTDACPADNPEIKKPIDVFDFMKQESMSKNSNKNFVGYAALSIADFVKELVKQDVHVMETQDPLQVHSGTSKNARSQAMLVMKFLGSLCENQDELKLYSGNGRVRVGTSFADLNQKRKEEVKALAGSIAEKAIAFVNNHDLQGTRKKKLTALTMQCGALRGMLEKKKDDGIPDEVKKTYSTWEDVKKSVGSK